jgi:hypothetical protein
MKEYGIQHRRCRIGRRICANLDKQQEHLACLGERRGQSQWIMPELGLMVEGRSTQYDERL